jgi:hypothetical protein
VTDIAPVETEQQYENCSPKLPVSWSSSRPAWAARQRRPRSGGHANAMSGRYGRGGSGQPCQYCS